VIDRSELNCFMNTGSWISRQRSRNTRAQAVRKGRAFDRGLPLAASGGSVEQPRWTSGNGEGAPLPAARQKEGGTQIRDGR
jgi:hypothetical protein